MQADPSTSETAVGEAQRHPELKALERSLKDLLEAKVTSGVAAKAAELLDIAPHRAGLALKAAQFLVGAGEIKQAERLLPALLETTPQALNPKFIKAILADGPDPFTVERLCEPAILAVLPIEVIQSLIVHLQQRKLVAKAVEVCHGLLRVDPTNVDVRLDLAALLRSTNDVPASREQLEIAFETAPQDDRVLRQLGRLEVYSRNYERAEQLMRTAVEVKPRRLAHRLDLARCILIQKRFADAAEFMRAAVQDFPEEAGAHSMLGHILRWWGRHDDALASLTRAVELDPNNTMAMLEIAQLKEEVGDCESGLDLHRRAAAIAGDPSYNASIFCYALLGAGRSREGWASQFNRVEHRALLALPDITPWRGEPLAGKSIMVIAENGVGDQIRDSCTYAELIAAAGRVTITCEPRLHSLFERSFPGARFIPVAREQRISEYERMLSMLIDERADAEMKQHDFCVLSPDLLYHFRGENAWWERSDIHLRPDPALMDVWRERVAALGPGLKVGISWRSGALNYNRECFYTRLEEWGPILSTPGVQFVNVQYDECEEEIAAAEAALGVRIHGWPDLNRKDDFEGMAALLSQLDLVLAPNTTVLEQAGSIGTPVWYMLRVPIGYDYWRCKDDQGTDRLYGSVRQIRGDRAWDSPSLIANTAAQLAKLAARAR